MEVIDKNQSGSSYKQDDVIQSNEIEFIKSESADISCKSFTDQQLSDGDENIQANQNPDMEFE